MRRALNDANVDFWLFSWCEAQQRKQRNEIPFVCDELSGRRSNPSSTKKKESGTILMIVCDFLLK